MHHMPVVMAHGDSHLHAHACGRAGSNAVAEYMYMCMTCVQVRQPLYKTSVQRWKQYKQQLEPLREALAPLIGRYEQMLAERLQKPPVKAAAAAVDASSTVGALGGGAEEATDYSEVKDEL